jgi:biotin carboxyl carrier protein
MKLHATIAENEFNVEIRREAGRVFANVDGREYELETHATPSGVTLRTEAGKIFDCRVAGKPSSGQSVDVFVGTQRYVVMLTDPKRLRGTAASGSHADGAARILAPMPGKVVRVLVEQGAQVEAGAGMIVVEAMKMQNEMKAPKTGVVTALNVSVGTTVNGGDVLAVIE